MDIPGNDTPSREAAPVQVVIGVDAGFEEFDPYYGVGSGTPATQYPIKAVFYLMGAKRFRSPTAAIRETWWTLAGGILLGVALAVAGTLGLLRLIIHLHVQPRPPVLIVYENYFGTAVVFDVKPAVIAAQQQEGKGNYYAYHLNIAVYYVLKLTNENQQVDFVADYIEAVLLFNGFPLSFDRVGAFHLRRRQSIYPVFTLYAIMLRLPLNVGYTLKPGIADLNNFDVRVTIEFQARMKMMMYKGLPGTVFFLRYRCELHQTRNSNDQLCRQVHGHMPDTSHLRFYRLANWISFYDLNGTISWPDYPADYFNPQINEKMAAFFNISEDYL